MTLKELWDRLLARAAEEEKAIANYFESHIHRVSAQVPERIHAEYPKMMADGKIVNSAEEESAIGKFAVAPAVSSTTGGISSPPNAPLEPPTTPATPAAPSGPPDQKPAGGAAGTEDKPGILGKIFGHEANSE